MIYPENAGHGQILVPCLYKAHTLTVEPNDNKKSQSLQLLLLIFLNECRGF